MGAEEPAMASTGEEAAAGVPRPVAAPLAVNGLPTVVDVAEPSLNDAAGGAETAHNHDLESESARKVAPEPEKQPKAAAKSVPIYKLFAFADRVDKLCIILGTVGAVATGCSMPALSLLFGRLINSFGTNMNDLDKLQDQVNKSALYFFFLAIFAAGAAYLEVALWSLAGERQSARIRMKYLRAILRQNIGFFDVETSTGEVIGRMSGDTLLIQDAISEKFGQYIRLVTQFFAGFAVAFYQGWLLTLVLLAVTPVLVISGATMMRIMTKFSSKGQEAYAKAGSLAEQTVGAIRTVVSFVGEKKSVESYNLSLQEAYKVGVVQTVAGGLGMGVTLFSIFGVYALALWYGSRLVADGRYNGGDVMNVIFAVLIGGMSLGQAAPNLAAIAQGQAAAYKMFEVIARTPPIDIEDTSGMTLPVVKGDIELKDVSFSYPARADVPIFKNLSLTIYTGQTVALVGESGSGKSTVISLMERFYDPEGGVVALDGIDIRKLQVRWLRSQLGLVNQEPALFTTTIRENIAYGKEGASDQEIEEAAKAANAHKFISRLPNGYDTQVGERGVQLSGGQKQRVTIARAVLKNPRILLLDEATSALDAESERVVQSALDHVMVGRTTVIVAHRLSTVINASKIAVVQRGAIVEEGTHAQLVNKESGAYAALVKLQAMAHHEVAKKSKGGDPDAIVMDNTAAESAGLAEEGGFVDRLVLSLSGLGEKESGPAKVQESFSGLGFPPDEESVSHSDQETLKPVPFSRLAKLAQPEWWLLLLGFLVAGANGVIFPMFALLLSSIINVFFDPDPHKLRKDADFWSTMFTLLAVGSFMVIFLQFATFGLMGERVIRRVRRLTFQAVLRQEVAWFDHKSHSSGHIGARLSTDSTFVKKIIGDQLSILIQNLVTLVVGLTIAFTASWKLTLVVLSIAPLLLFGGWCQMYILRGFITQAKKLYESASQVANDATGNVRTVAAFCAEERVTGLYKQQVAYPEKVGMRRAHIGGIALAFSQFIMFAAYSLAFWYGGKLVRSGEVSFKDVLRVFFAITFSAMGVSQTTGMAPDMGKAKAAVASIFAILDRKPLIDASAPGETLTPVTGAIAFKNVDFAYPARPHIKVCQSLSFSISPGQTAALVGESGSGKSTCIALLERFYDVTGGSVLVDQVDIRKLQLHWLRRQMGLVSQEPVLFSATVKENIAYGKETATEEEIEAAARAGNVHSFVSQLPDGYNTQVGERGVQLSGGQKQRVAIARAVLKNPRILLLDEATSALDAESERIVQDALDTVMQGRTTIVIAHRLSTIQNADKIMVVQGGGIVEQGTHNELLGVPNGAYANLVKLHKASSK